MIVKIRFTCLVVLLQDEDFFAGFAHESRCDETADAGPDDDGVQVWGDVLNVEPLLDDSVPHLLVMDIIFSRLGAVLLKWVWGTGPEPPCNDFPKFGR